MAELHEGARTLARAIKMHEFLMSGGVPTTKNAAGNMQYSDPITVAEGAECPWHHSTECVAWNEIVAGRGYWTKMESDLEKAKQFKADLDADPEADEAEVEVWRYEIDNLTETLAMRPMDFKALRERTPEVIAQGQAKAKAARAGFQAALDAAAKTAAQISNPKLREALEHQPSIALKRADGSIDAGTVLCSDHTGLKDEAIFTAHDDTKLTDWVVVPKARYRCFACERNAPAKIEGPKRTGNPWDKVDAKAAQQGDGWHTNMTGGPTDRPSYSGYSNYERPPAPKPKSESRDLAAAAFATESVPDVIEIDGDEGEEG